MSATSEEIAALFAEFGPRYQRWVGQALPVDGMSLPRLRLLAALYEHGACNLRSLTQTLGVSAQNVSVLVDALHVQGLVLREADPADRRATVLSLSEPGRRLVADGMRVHLQAVSSLFDVLTPAQRGHLAAVLRHLLAELATRASPASERS